MKEELGLSRSDQSGNSESLTHAATTEAVSDEDQIHTGDDDLLDLISGALVALEGLTDETDPDQSQEDLDGAISDLQKASTMRAAQVRAIPDRAGTEPRLNSGPVTEWHQAAMLLGESLTVCGPAGYYGFTPDEWLTWARDQVGSTPHAQERSVADPLSSSSVTIDEARECALQAWDDGELTPTQIIDHLITVVLASVAVTSTAIRRAEG
jgi:hypothetical protein